MCYHNSINTDKQQLEQKYKKKLVKDNKLILPVYHANAFEFGLWPIITAAEEIQVFNWGLIPHWATKTEDIKSIKVQTLNARVETISEKASFKNAKRCLVPSTGFFEWQAVGKQKVPYFIQARTMPLFSMAGLYDQSLNEKGEKIYTFSIVTTEANELMANIHNTKMRMPLILKPEEENTWLEDRIHTFHGLKSEEMNAYTVANALTLKNPNSAEVLIPKEIQIQKQLSLF